MKRDPKAARSAPRSTRRAGVHRSSAQRARPAPLPGNGAPASLRPKSVTHSGRPEAPKFIPLASGPAAITHSPRRHPNWRPEWPQGSVIVGQTATGRHVILPPEMRKLGLHVLGLPNQGKSKLLEGMARQDILALCGARRCVIFVD